MKYIILFFIISVLIFLISSSYEDHNVYQLYSFKSHDGSEQIYIKSKNWGLTLDHQLTSISMNSNKKEIGIDSLSEYIFKGLDPFLYKFENDTLFIYNTNKIRVPPDLKLSKISIFQIIIKNTQYTELFKKANDNSYGLHQL